MYSWTLKQKFIQKPTIYIYCKSSCKIYYETGSEQHIIVSVQMTAKYNCVGIYCCQEMARSRLEWRRRLLFLLLLQWTKRKKSTAAVVAVVSFVFISASPNRIINEKISSQFVYQKTQYATVALLQNTASHCTKFP